MKQRAPTVLRLLARRLPGRLSVLARHAIAHKRIPRHKSPRDFWDLVLQRKLDGLAHDPLMSLTADKHRVRAFVAERVGAAYLIPQICAVTSADEINFEALPEQFIMKAAHASSWNLIVKDKSTLTADTVYDLAKEWLASDYDFGGETHYRYIPRCVVFETLLLDSRGEPPIDYKIWVINRRVQLFQVDQDRFIGRRLNYYDRDWNLLTLNWKSPTFTPGAAIPRPAHLDELITVAEKLGAPFEVVRVDLYQHKGRVYFSEITHTPDAGLNRFTPESFNAVAMQLYFDPYRAIPPEYHA